MLNVYNNKGRQWIHSNNTIRLRYFENKGQMHIESNYLLSWPSYIALKFPLTVMLNFQHLNGCYGNRGR